MNINLEELYIDLTTAKKILVEQGLGLCEVRFSLVNETPRITAIGYAGGKITGEDMFYMEVNYDPDLFLGELQERLVEFNPEFIKHKNLIRDLNALAVRAGHYGIEYVKTSLEALAESLSESLAESSTDKPEL